MSTTNLPAHFIPLVQDALLKSFWYKRTLRDFLRRSYIDPKYLAGLSDEETKRDWLDRLFPLLERSKKGRIVIQRMGRDLIEQKTFSDLERHEDSKLKISAAKAAVAALRDYFREKHQAIFDEKERQAVRQRAAKIQQDSIRSRQDLQELSERLDELSKRIGTTQAGFDFQDWFYHYKPSPTPVIFIAGRFARGSFRWINAKDPADRAILSDRTIFGFRPYYPGLE